MTVLRAHSWILIGMAGLCLAIARPASAWEDSSESHHAHSDEVTHDHDDHGGESHGHGVHTIHGEPASKNYFNEPRTAFLYWSPQIFIWTLLLFLPLWFILQRLVWKPMILALEERDRAIAESLATAARLREEAKHLGENLDVETMRAHQEAKALLDKARESASTEVSELLSRARESAAETQRTAQAEVADAVARAIPEIEQSAKRVGAKVVATLVGGSR